MRTLKQMYLLNKFKNIEIKHSVISNVPNRGEMLSLFIGEKKDRMEDCLCLAIMLDEIPGPDKIIRIKHIKFDKNGNEILNIDN